MGLRERVMEATLGVLLARGWRGVTTEAVAKRAHISKKTLYKLFPSKEALLEAALEELLRVNFAKLDEILSSPSPPLVRVHRFLEEVTEVITRAQVAVLEQARGVSPRLWQRLEVERGRRLEAVGKLVREAQARGLVRPDLDVDMWLSLLRTVIVGLMNPERVLRERLSAHRILQTLRVVFFEGILTEEGRKALPRSEERGGT